MANKIFSKIAISLLVITPILIGFLVTYDKNRPLKIISEKHKKKFSTKNDVDQNQLQPGTYSIQANLGSKSSKENETGIVD